MRAGLPYGWCADLLKPGRLYLSPESWRVAPLLPPGEERGFRINARPLSSAGGAWR